MMIGLVDDDDDSLLQLSLLLLLYLVVVWYVIFSIFCMFFSLEKSNQLCQYRVKKRGAEPLGVLLAPCLCVI